MGPRNIFNFNAFLASALLLFSSGLMASPLEEACSFQFANLSRFEKPPTTGIGAKTYEFLLNSQSIANLMLRPFKPLAKRGSIKVVGKLRSTKAAAEKVANHLEDFDNGMTQMGFRIPGSTRVIMGEKPFLPNPYGPFSVSTRIFNIRDFKLPENTIAMNAILKRENVALDPSVLMHERTHGVLFATYKPTAFTSKDITIQEALADFMSSLHRDDPEMGVGVLIDKLPIRNIKNGDSMHPNGSFDKVVVAGDLTEGSPHSNSLLFSKTLWTLREKLGLEKTRSVIKDIVDDLNLHFESAQKPNGLSLKLQDRWNQYYFLASLKKTLEDGGELEGVKVIDQIAKNSRIGAEVEALSSSLKRSGNPFYSGTSNPGQTLFMHTTGAGLVIGEGYIVYEIVGPNGK